MMGQKLSYSPDVHIVVVGGGYAGHVLCLTLLDHKANFTLIDSRDAFHHNVASVRAIVRPDLIKKTLIPYEATFGQHFRQGRMVGVDPKNKTLRLEDGEDIKYDILVLAVGTTGNVPSKFGHIDKQPAMELYTNYAEKVLDSQRVVMVGGGAVGVEISGEIATQYPDKEVTLIHGGKNLVWNHLSHKFQAKVLGGLKELHVNVKLNERVVNLDAAMKEVPCEILTDKGTRVVADLVIPCTGLTINSDAYLHGLGDYIDEMTALRINHHFQVEDHGEIFAMGDCCGSGDPHTAYLAQEHAKFVAQNISRKLSGETMVIYPGNVAPFELVLTMGRDRAFGELKGGWAMPDWLCRRLKSDLFIKRYWETMRQTPPT